MPELPDITIYIEALSERVLDQPIRKLHIASPFLVRSVEPDIHSCADRPICDIRRLGKRIVFVLSFEPPRLCLVLHLMIAGRLRWEPRGRRPPGRIGLAALHFDTGTLLITEAATQKRASLHLVEGEESLAAMDPGGMEVLPVYSARDLFGSRPVRRRPRDRGLSTLPAAPPVRSKQHRAAFAAALRRESHTLKRALTDPRLFAGIGNAYSDEILHAAGLSPVQLTTRLSDDEVTRLYKATLETLSYWIDELRQEFAAPSAAAPEVRSARTSPKLRFPGPGEITAFRPGFAVHGRFGEPCPRCGTTVQRIRYAENETNYCPRCQTAGRILADRSLSRLLKDDWPRSIDDLDPL